MSEIDDRQQAEDERQAEREQNEYGAQGKACRKLQEKEIQVAQEVPAEEMARRPGDAA
jgi:ribosomal protein L44E